MPHSHVYIPKPVSSVEERDGLAWDVTTKIPTCECGHIQPTRAGLPRPPEVAVSRPGGAPLPEDDVARLVAQALRRGSDVTRRHTLLLRLGGAMRETETDGALIRLSCSGALRIHQRWDASWLIWKIEVHDRNILEEVAHPGQRAAWDAAVEEAVAVLPDTLAGASLRAALQQRPSGWDFETVRVACALVQHKADERTSLARVFSSTLGDSKLLHRHRGRIRAVLGDIEKLGVRSVDDLILIAGSGTLTWPNVELPHEIDHGMVGFTRNRLRELTQIRADNVLFIENKEVFLAVAVDRQVNLPGFAIYMAGNFGATIEHMLRVVAGRPWMWADLDPFCVSFVRHAHEVRSDVAAYRMTPADLVGEGAIPLPAKYQNELDKQLRLGGPLQDLLEAMREHGIVREQETQVSSRDARVLVPKP